MNPNSELIATIQPLIPALRRYARGLMRDRSEADDLVQDVLERVISRWHQRRPNGSARAWTFRILHNLAMDRMRQRATRAAPGPMDSVPEDRLASPPTQEDKIRYDDILSLIAALSEEQRSVLLLIAVEDLSYAEAAEVLDIPVGTVMSRLSRARERLHRMSAGEDTDQKSPMLRIVK